MVTLVYRNDKSILMKPKGTKDMSQWHPLVQMRIIRDAFVYNIDIKLYTNHHQCVNYVGYLIRTKQIKSDSCELDCDGGKVPFTDRGDLLYGWYSDISELGFGLLFGKAGDFRKEGLEII